MSQKVNPQMLILAREARGITQSELAAELSITQGNLSKLESGILDISDDVLNRVAQVLNFPASFFYQTDPIYGYGSACIYHRKRQSVPMNVLRQILAQININRIQVSRLLNGAEIEHEDRFFRMDIVDYDGHANHIAKLVRQSWGLPPGPIENLTRAIENAGGIVIKCSFGTNKIDAI